MKGTNPFKEKKKPSTKKGGKKGAKPPMPMPPFKPGKGKDNYA
jgi:hypothetical protein